MKRTKPPKNQNPNNGGLKKKPELDRVRNELSAREVLACHEYLVDLDKTGAAIRAKLIPEYVKKKRQSELAEEVFNQPHVQQYLDQCMKERTERTKITSDKVLNHIAAMAFFDPIELYTEVGTLKPMSEIPPHIRRCVKKIKHQERYAGRGEDRIKIGRDVEIEICDPLAAAQTLLKHNGELPGGTKLNINYNQYNQYNQTNNVQQNYVNLSDLSQEELKVAKSMLGDVDDEEILELQKIEEEVVSNGNTQTC